MTCVLGLDIGGSTTRARVAVDGETVAEARAGSASLTAAGREAASRALDGVLGDLAPALTAPPDAVCAGAAGSEVGGGGRWLTDALTALTGCERVTVVSDVALLLPAAGHRDGLAIVAGTGSVVHGRRGERTARAGGWGFLLGDEGGGYRLVIEALRTVLARRDAGDPAGPLREALGAHEDAELDGLVGDVHADPRPRRWAALAPAVLACGDPAVEAILRDGGATLAGQAAAVAARLELPRTPVVLAGGLLDAPAAERALVDALAGALPGWTAQRLRAPAVAGAVALAERAVAET